MCGSKPVHRLARSAPAKPCVAAASCRSCWSPGGSGHLRQGAGQLETHNEGRRQSWLTLGSRLKPTHAWAAISSYGRRDERQRWGGAVLAASAECLLLIPAKLTRGCARAARRGGPPEAAAQSGSPGRSAPAAAAPDLCPPACSGWTFRGSISREVLDKESISREAQGAMGISGRTAD